MDSRLIRILFVLLAIGMGAGATYFLNSFDTQILRNRSSEGSLQEQGSQILRTIADVRAAQAGYVAQGQGEAFWMNRVSVLLPILDQQVADFKAGLTSPAALANLEPAIAAIENLHKLDDRAQDYVKSHDPLPASDLIFSDGLEAAGSAAKQVDAALKSELSVRSAGSAVLRTQEMMVLGAAAAGILLLLAILAVSGGQPTAAEARETMGLTRVTPVPTAAAPQGSSVNSTVKASVGSTVRDAAPLAEAAKICTDLARIANAGELPALLARAARLLDASGMIVWVADSTGRELRPAMAFGYADQVVARMGAIPRDAANAAAAAYRAAQLRTVNGTGTSNGALVAPLVTADGCIGVLSAEMKGGAEKTERSQALASIVAAQLATLVSAASSTTLNVAAQA